MCGPQRVEVALCSRRIPGMLRVASERFEDAVVLALQRGRKLPWPADAWEAEGQSLETLRSYGSAVTVKNLP